MIEVSDGLQRYRFKNNKIIDIVTKKTIKPINNKVRIIIYDKECLVTLDWLNAYRELKMFLPEGYRHHVSNLEFFKYDLTSHGFSWNWIATFKKPVTLKHNNKFRLVAMWPNIAVDKYGNIINVIKNKLVYNISKDTVANEFNYRFINIFDYRLGRYVKHRVHRLVALAWVDNKDYSKKPIVDHKDKNRANSYYKNLEWVDFSINNERRWN